MLLEKIQKNIFRQNFFPGIFSWNPLQLSLSVFWFCFVLFAIYLYVERTKQNDTNYAAQVYDAWNSLNCI